MAASEDGAEDPKADRRGYWFMTTGGAITIMEGLFLGLFGIYILGAYLHQPNDILIPLGAIAFASSVLSLIGADATFKHNNYALAIVGSAIPATVFLGGFVIAIIGESGFWKLLLPLGILATIGVLLVAASRKIVPTD
ncbi:MAG: hypothetical protein MUO87_08335 [Thermoplasmata archaeon]|nr:hypothetical protein [Thermoplasmata archaeon]